MHDQQSPFFTVVIPTYNRAAMLRTALTSVITQTFTDFQVLVVDNHSDDETIEVIDSLNDDRVRVLSIHNNGVIAASRNLGIHEARGEWVAFLDADDHWTEDKLDQVHASIDGQADAVLASHDMQVIEDGEPRYTWKCQLSREDPFESLLFDRNSVVTSAASVRRKTALELGGFSERPEHIGVEDYDFWLRLSRRGEFICLPAILGAWQRHETNHNRNLAPEVRVGIRETYFRIWESEHPGSDGTIRRARGRMLADVSHRLVLERRFTLARKYAIKSLSKDPVGLRAWTCLALSVLHVAR